MKINEKNWVVRFFYTWGRSRGRAAHHGFLPAFLFMETAALITSKDIPASWGDIQAYMFTIIVAGSEAPHLRRGVEGADSREGQEK